MRLKTLTFLPLSIVLVAGCAPDPSKTAPKASVGEVKKAQKTTPPDAKPSVDTATNTQKKTTTGTNKTYKLTGDIGFVGSKVTASHTGLFKDWTGEATVGDTVESSSFKFDVQVKSVISDPENRRPWSEKLDRHLVSEDFFFAEKFPRATFASKAIKSGAEGDATHTVSGDLTMRGVTRPVTFPAKIKMTAAGMEAAAKFTINRTDWGIVYKGKADNLIREGVVMNIQLKGAAAQ